MPIFNSPADFKKIPSVDFVAPSGTQATKEVVANQVKGFFYIDENGDIRYYNGVKWTGAGEGALSPKGTLDYSVATETSSVKHNVPATGNSKGDMWVVSKTGSYTYYNGTTNVTAILNSGDYLFCSSVNADGTGAVWNLVESGDSKFIATFAYDSTSPTTQTWTFTNPLFTSDLVWRMYKVSTTGTVTTDNTEECNVSFTYDSSDSSYGITISFGHPLVEGESYKVVFMTV